VSDRRVSLAAGTLPGTDAADTIRIASEAGFALVGLRPDPSRLESSYARATRQVADDCGMTILDVEVIRLGVTAPDVIAGLIDFAAAVRASYLLVVSDDPDTERTIDRFAGLCQDASGSGLRPVLEFMAFTAVQDLGAARRVVAASGQPGGGILVDALHLARSGGSPADLAGVDASLLPYLQLCDGPRHGPGDVEAMANEARHGRLLPGSGELPLADLLAVTPGVTASVEVQSDTGWASRTPVQWAQDALHAATAVIAAAGG
jgi:sugar phosphate isomerase/epimerase